MPPRHPQSMPSRSFGLEHISVRIISVDGIWCQTRDRYGALRRLRRNSMRANGALPRVGEEWLIDRSMGDWAFASIVRSNPPVISPGTTEEVLGQLLDALHDAGFIVNESGLGGA